MNPMERLEKMEQAERKAPQQASIKNVLAGRDGKKASKWLELHRMAKSLS